VVKDPTQPDPSLVTEVKDSSLTILHQIYSASEGFYTSHRYREREGAPLRVSSKGGTFVELDQFDLAKEKGFWRFQLLGFLCRGHSIILGSSRRYFGGDLIYLRVGRFPQEEGAFEWIYS
jgi:hypothetical protein